MGNPGNQAAFPLHPSFVLLRELKRRMLREEKVLRLNRRGAKRIE